MSLARGLNVGNILSEHELNELNEFMVSYELSNETGWQSIPGDTHTIVAHFRDGHEEKMSLVDFLVMGRKRNQVKRIDCYKEGEL
jgi:hypothetical protein